MLNFEVKIYKMGAGFYQAKFLDPKTGKRKRKRFATLKDAKAFKLQIETTVVTKGASAFSDLRISSAMKFFLDKNPNSIVKDRVNHFKSFIDTFGIYRVSELTVNDLKTWFADRKKEGNLSELTMNRIRSQFFGFFEYLVDESHISFNPLKKIKFKTVDSPRRSRVVLSVDEVRELLTNAHKFDSKVLYPYLYVLAHTGARRSEVLHLERRDVDLKTELIHFRGTKNGHDRSVKMSAGLKALLEQVLKSHEFDHVFSDEVGKCLHESVIRNLINKLNCYFPMDKKWGCHSLRHSFAYNFLKSGGEMYQLQAILGHRGIQVTVDLYGQLKAQDIENPSPYDF